MSFTTPEVTWVLIMKLPHTEVKFYCEVKSQTGLSSLWVSGKRELRMRESTYKVTWRINHVVTWQIKNVISLLSQGLWIPNLAGWWLWMKGPHPQSHLTYQPHDHVTNQKRYISTFTRPMEPHLTGWWLKVRGLLAQSYMTLQSCDHMTNKKRYVSIFTKPMDPKLSGVVT